MPKLFFKSYLKNTNFWTINYTGDPSWHSQTKVPLYLSYSAALVPPFSLYIANCLLRDDSTYLFLTSTHFPVQSFPNSNLTKTAFSWVTSDLTLLKSINVFIAHVTRPLSSLWLCCLLPHSRNTAFPWLPRKRFTWYYLATSHIQIHPFLNIIKF